MGDAGELASDPISEPPYWDRGCESQSSGTSAMEL